MNVWKIISLSALAVAIVLFMAQIGLDAQYVNSGSRVPQPATGLVYIVRFNRQFAYIAYAEHLELKILFWITCFTLPISAVAGWKSRNAGAQTFKPLLGRSAPKPDTYAPILKRVGGVLLAVGLVDIGIMIYAVSHSITYSSSFNIFAVIAGVFLLLGSFRAVSIVRHFSVFILTGFLTLPLVLAVVQPLDLTLTEARLYPVWALREGAIFGFFVLLLSWVVTELGREPIRAALTSAGIKQPDLRIPAVVALGTALVVIVAYLYLPVGVSAQRAVSMAEHKVGSHYHFHASRENIVSYSRGNWVTVLVTAWNTKEIRYIPVGWVAY